MAARYQAHVSTQAADCSPYSGLWPGGSGTQPSVMNCVARRTNAGQADRLLAYVAAHFVLTAARRNFNSIVASRERPFRGRARTRPRRTLMMGRAALLIVTLSLAGCGATSGASTAPTSSIPKARPQAIEPVAGEQAVVTPGGDPVGDVNAHAPSLAQVKHELLLQLIAVRASNSRYINPLRYVAVWGRTDQGVDASMPVGAPILAPCKIKIVVILPGWFAGQPLVAFELLEGPDAGKIQFVAEQITGIPPVGTILQQGQAIARYAASGTNIEYGWATVTGLTLARATTGYTEGQVTPAGQAMRAWLNSLGANAGNG
jgi:hypothetical protein